MKKQSNCSVIFNPVAKHAHKYNKDMIHADKKKQSKRGYKKHKTIDTE